jgi:hypothetical protein
MLWKRNRGPSSPNDTSFLGCDFGDRVTQELLVVEIDVSDY